MVAKIKIRIQVPHLDQALRRHPVLEVRHPQRRGIVHPILVEVLLPKILVGRETARRIRVLVEAVHHRILVDREIARRIRVLVEAVHHKIPVDREIVRLIRVLVEVLLPKTLAVHETARRIRALVEAVHPKIPVSDEAAVPAQALVLARNRPDRAVQPVKREIAVVPVQALVAKIGQHEIVPLYHPNHLHHRMAALVVVAGRGLAQEVAVAHLGTEAVADQDRLVHLAILARPEKEARIKALAHREILARDEIKDPVETTV